MLSVAFPRVLVLCRRLSRQSDRRWCSVGSCCFVATSLSLSVIVKLLFRRHQSQLAGADKVMQKTDELPNCCGKETHSVGICIELAELEAVFRRCSCFNRTGGTCRPVRHSHVPRRHG